MSSYSSFYNNISQFNSEDYLKTLCELESIDLYYDFIKNYKEIENEDSKKPTFNQPIKFKKQHNNQYKNYKNLKSLKEEHKNTWIHNDPTEDNNKIAILIKTYLNKISEETYKNIGEEFINELLLVDNQNLFSILSEEILKKCIFDIKFRHLYLYICQKIWNNKQIHLNLVNIIKNDNNYSWETKDGNKKYTGFMNENQVINDIFSKLNFKKYFINHIQNLYINKDMSFEGLTEEEIYLKKKKVLLLVELVGLMYIEKYINFEIINIIIIDLLHIDKFSGIEEIEYEAFYLLIKFIKENKNNYNSLIEYKNIFQEYIDIINQLLINSELSKRSQFFLNDIISMLNVIIVNENENNNNNNLYYDKEVKEINKDIDIKELNKESKLNKNIFNSKIVNINNDNINELSHIYSTLNEQNKNDVIYKSIDMYLNQRKTNEHILTLLKNINEPNIIYNIIEKMVENIDDIMLDIPNADVKLIYLIEFTNFNHNNRNNLLEMLKNINSDSDSD